MSEHSEHKGGQINVNESRDAEAAPVVIRPAPDLDGLEAGMDLPPIVPAGVTGSHTEVASPSIAADDATPFDAPERVLDRSELGDRVVLRLFVMLHAVGDAGELGAGEACRRIDARLELADVAL